MTETFPSVGVVNINFNLAGLIVTFFSKPFFPPQPALVLVLLGRCIGGCAQAQHVLERRTGIASLWQNMAVNAQPYDSSLIPCSNTAPKAGLLFAIVAVRSGDGAVAFERIDSCRISDQKEGGSTFQKCAGRLAKKQKRPINLLDFSQLASFCLGLFLFFRRRSARVLWRLDRLVCFAAAGWSSLKLDFESSRASAI